MATAWLLPGGASLGAVQAGQAQALFGAGLAPDLLIGTSAGALNAAWLAADPTAHGAASLVDLWLGVRRREIFPWSPRSVVPGLVGRADHLVSSRPFAAWIEAHLPYRHFDETAIPLQVTATDLTTGESVFFSRGPVIPALLASSAVPGVYPPVSLDGRLLVDGGMVADTPVGRAVEAGADRVYILPTLGPEPAGRPRAALGVIQRTLNLLVAHARQLEVSTWTDRVEVFVLPAPYIPGISPFSFKHGAELMRSARQMTEAWLPTAVPAPGQGSVFRPAPAEVVEGTVAGA